MTKGTPERRTIALLAAVWTAVAACGAEPVLKVGFLTDTHVKIPAASAQLVRGAFRIFRTNGVDAVLHAGDLADWHYPEAYRHYRKAIDDIFDDPAKRPLFYYTHANHDVLNPAKKKFKGKDRMLPFGPAFKEMDEILGITHPLLAEPVIKGIPFLILPQTWSLVGGATNVEKRLAALCAAHPGKPVVVMCHNPPEGTVFQGDGMRQIRETFEKFPQVISFSGHRHTSLRSPRCIWQGSFTAVDVGCLYFWGGRLNGRRTKDKPAYLVLVAEFYPERLVIRRFDARDGEEFEPANPWTVPLPFDPATAPYTMERGRAAEKPVSFPEGADVTAKFSGEGTNAEVHVTFPLSLAEERTEKFRVTVEERTADGWRALVSNETFSAFHQRPAERPARHEHTFRTGALPPAERIRVTVTPVGFYGTEGKPIATRSWNSISFLSMCPEIIVFRKDGGASNVEKQGGIVP